MAKRLNQAERGYLAEFEARRAEYDRALAECTTEPRWYTCPACGFPTLRERQRGEVCVLCQWPDAPGARARSAVLTRRRVEIAKAVSWLEPRHEIDYSLEVVLYCFEHFAAALARGKATVDPYFEQHLLNVLPTTSRLP